MRKKLITDFTNTGSSGSFTLIRVCMSFMLLIYTWHFGLFQVGTNQKFDFRDPPVFVYTTNHAVDIIDESDYNSCNSGNALYSYSGGKTTITLTTPGPMYFLCPIIGHCQAGMKLSITVAAAGASSGSPSTTSTTPAITTTTSPTSSGAGGMFGNMNHWVVIGFSVVVAGLVGFMG